ncbi:hypothetical protein [Paenibacillus sp. YIM B09110]
MLMMENLRNILERTLGGLPNFIKTAASIWSWQARAGSRHLAE